jgi:hypothetical protein
MGVIRGRLTGLAGALVLAWSGGHASAAEQPDSWRFGIGTGMQFLHAEGDVGFTSFRGAEQVELEMTPEDFQDLMASALGLNVHVARGRWSIAAPGQAVGRKLDKDWTDLLVGVVHDLAISERVHWRTGARLGFGESDDYWSARTALIWRVADALELGAYVDFRRVDFEDGSPGDPSWYLYDADEWGPGLSFAYLLH